MDRHGSSGAPYSPRGGWGPEEVRRYEERRWRGPDQRLVMWLEERALSRLLDRLAARSGRGERVLEMPCGYGRLTPLLARRAARLVAGDLRPGMAARARERLSAAARERVAAPATGGGREGVPASFCAAAIHALPFPEGTFRGSVVIRLLHHFPEPERRRAALSEIRRVTAGWAVVSFYTGAPFHRLVRRLQGRSRKTVAREQAEAELRAAGFRIAGRHRPLPGLHAQTFYLLVTSS